MVLNSPQRPKVTVLMCFTTKSEFLWTHFFVIHHPKISTFEESLHTWVRCFFLNAYPKWWGFCRSLQHKKMSRAVSTDTLYYVGNDCFEVCLYRSSSQLVHKGLHTTACVYSELRKVCRSAIRHSCGLLVCVFLLFSVLQSWNFSFMQQPVLIPVMNTTHFIFISL